MSLRIVNIALGSIDPHGMDSAALKVSRERGFPLDVSCYSSDSVDEDSLLYKDLCDQCKNADLVLVRCVMSTERFRRFEAFKEVLSGCPGYVYVHSSDPDVRLTTRYLFKGDDDDFIRISRYIGNRGDENEEGLILWLATRTGLIGDGFPEPHIQRSNGIYHPDFPRDVSLEEYLDHVDPSKPTVGIVFTSSYWIYRDLAHIDALIEEIEGRGLNTIPVFFNTGSAKETRLNTANVFSTYLMDGDRSRVDVIIANSPFSQLVNSRTSRGIRTPDEENFYRMLNDVPVIQAMMISSRYEDYETSRCTGDRTRLMTQAAWVEMDGQIITVPISEVQIDPDNGKRNIPIPDRIENLADTAEFWVRMRRKPRKDRKVAILLYQYGGNGTIGSAAGLDGLESSVHILKALSDGGYTVDHVPDDGKCLSDELMARITNDLCCNSSSDIESKAADLVSKKEYSEYFDSIPEFDRQRMIEHWGEPPGDVMVDKGRCVIPGLINGNVFVSVQPVRPWSEQTDRIYHDPELFPPHQYLSFYRWLRDDFKADAVIHVGTHGSLEWLPGKALGLSSKCCPSYIQSGMINIYPYLIDDPGEGIQAKRRSEAVLIGHMPPTMRRAGSYDELGRVEVPLNQYFKLSSSKDAERKTALVSEILESCRSIEILDDLGLDDDIPVQEFEKNLGEVHDYLMQIKDSLVRDGIHVLGRVPEGDQMDEMVYSLTRAANGDIPPLREGVSEAIGIVFRQALENPSDSSGSDHLNFESVDIVESFVDRLLVSFRERGYEKDACLAAASDMLGKIGEGLSATISYICDVLVGNIRRMSDEIVNLMHALDGGYVLPGPSGAPTRGGADLLPMGRNYYSIDPDSIPTHAAWGIGKKMADQMIERFVSDRGTYPREIGFILWATDTMKTDGDDIAYVMWLLGVRPIWSPSSGQVLDIEVVPLEELGRPRVDVTIRISGLFRDAYPNLIDLLDRAVRMVASLDESDEDNALAANLRNDIVDGMASGMKEDEARKAASARIFGSAPGCYGPGINQAIESSAWHSVQDLADIYVAWGSYAYGKGIDGVQSKDGFIRNLSRVQATVKNLPDREIDMIDMDDVYGYLGGMNAFVRAYGRKDASTYMGDSSDKEKVRINGTAEELKFIFRRKVLNPRFIEGLKAHGFNGVHEISKMTDYIFGWDATSDIVEKWMYDGLAERYLLDEDTSEWMRDDNPYAMMDIVARLLEAISRGMWDADDEMRERMEKLYLELEERIEEIDDRRSFSEIGRILYDVDV